MLDLDEVSDVLHEGLVEARRGQDNPVEITWWDVADAAALLLRHIASVVNEDTES